MLTLLGAAHAATTLTLGELETTSPTSGSVPVLLHTDVAVPALQMDVLFDPAAHTVTSALPGTLPTDFRVDSYVVEPGRLRVVVGAASNASLVDGTIFQVPLTAMNEFSTFYPVVLTGFALSSPQGTPVAGKLAPRVRLLNLASDGQVDGHAGVTLAVEAGATDANIARVEYYVGGVKIGQSTAAPFTFIWTAPGSGPFIIQAVAFDSNGLQTASRSIPVVITHVGTKAVQAIYSGLITDNPFTVGSTGYVQFATTGAGSFTVRATLGGVSAGQVGQFAADGTATVRFSRGPGKTPVTMLLQAYATDLVDQIVGQITDGTPNGNVIENATFVSELSADRAVFTPGTREPAQQGQYTILLPAPETPTTGAPLGTGIGIANISKSGTITSIFALADGTVLSQGTYLSKDGLWPLYLLGGVELLTGPVLFSDIAGVSDFGGSPVWYRVPTSGGGAFSGGFQQTLDLVGSRFVQPPANQRVLNLANAAGNAIYHAENGGLTTPFEQFVTMDSTSRVLDVEARSVLTMPDRSNGYMPGYFLHPQTGAVVSLQGMTFQKQNIAGGFFSGGLGGDFSLRLNPAFPPPVQAQPQSRASLPLIAAYTPAENGRVVTPQPIVVTGAAAAAAPLSAIRYQTLFQGSLSVIQTAVGTDSWSITHQPVGGAGGTYRFFVKAVDTAGNESDIVSKTVFYSVPTQLTVGVNGPGIVSPEFNGTTGREIGKVYTIATRPNTGHRFVGWTGGVTSSSAVISFTMTDGLAIQANFE